MGQESIVFHQLYEIMDDPTLSLVEKQRQALACGREFLGVEHSHIQRHDDSSNDTIVASDGDNPNLSESVTLDRSTTYCRRVISTDGPVTLTDAREEGWADDPAYKQHGLECYLGTTISVHGDVYGTVCFSSREPRESAFTGMEKAVVELLARLLGREIESSHHEQLITETQQATQQAAKKYETFLQEVPDAVFLVDADTVTISEANKRAAELTDYALSQLVGMSILDLHPPEERDRYADLFDTEFTDGRRDQFADGTPLYLRRADGTDCPIEMAVSTVHIDGQEYLQSFVRDISAQREREQELERTNEFLQQTQEAADLGGWEYDLRSKNLHWSDEVYRIHGLSSDYEPTVDEALEFYHPEDRSIISDAFEELTTEGEPFDREIRIVADDGTVRWVRTIGRPVYGDDGEIVAVRGVFQDVTDQKERERDLRIKSRALEESTVGITIADADEPNHPIVYANDGFTRLTGYPKQRVLGNNCRFLQGEDTDRATVTEIREAIESNTPIQTEILNYRADGTPFWNKLTIAPVIGADSDEVAHYVGIQEDVTAEKRRARLIEVLNRVLRHNLRNDMNVIRGYADTIAERTEGETAQMARKISEKSSDLSTLSEKAQDFQTVVRDPDPLAPRDVLADVEAVVTKLRTKFPQTEFSIEASASEDVMATVELQLALRELGANAAQYGDSPEVTYRIETTADDEVAIHVQDGGPGLPEMERHILEAGRETPLEHSSGLGLWLINWTVTRLGGEVTTSIDDGTVVTIRLPSAADGAVLEHRDAALSTQSK